MLGVIHTCYLKWLVEGRGARLAYVCVHGGTKRFHSSVFTWGRAGSGGLKEGSSIEGVKAARPAKSPASSCPSPDACIFLDPVVESLVEIRHLRYNMRPTGQPNPPPPPPPNNAPSAAKSAAVVVGVARCSTLAADVLTPAPAGSFVDSLPGPLLLVLSQPACSETT